MKKNSVIKIFDYSEKFKQTGRQKTVDATGVFVFYSLLLESLAYIANVDGMIGIPDISKTQTTYLKNGRSPVPAIFIEIAQNDSTVANVSYYFSANLIPNIPKGNQSIVLDAVLALVEGDISLGKSKQTAIKKMRKEKTPADFLAEVFVLAVRVGNNKIVQLAEMDNAIMLVLKNMDDIQAKLNLFPKITPITPPEVPGSDEQQYITALYDAYDDVIEDGVLPSDDIAQYPKYEKDLKTRRIEYFAAEAVRRGTRENFRNNDSNNLFWALMTETLDGISDVYAMDYRHGYERLLKVMGHATNLRFDNCILGRIPGWVGASQKKGVCHILVNEQLIKGWVNNEE